MNQVDRKYFAYVLQKEQPYPYQAITGKPSYLDTIHDLFLGMGWVAERGPNLYLIAL